MSWKDKQSRYAGYVCLETVYLLLENALTECTVRLESDELERLRTCRLVMDEVPEKFDAFVRWPYYRMRGKPVTEEQEFEVIRRTERCVCPLFYNSHPYEVVSNCHFKNWWLDPHRFPAHCGWVHPNGIVGINNITAQKPNFLELLTELLGYQKAFPALDFKAAITSWNEHPGLCYSDDCDR